MSLLFTVLPYLLVFITSLYLPYDPDLGWHLKYGEYFWHNLRLLNENIFSTLMPNYYWVNTSWLTDILTYTIFHYWGFVGLTVVGAIVITLTFYFFSKAASLSLWSQILLFPPLLYALSVPNSISFRGQLLTFLLLGILFYLMQEYRRRPWLLFLTIPLFTLWSNLNGEFLLGVAIFGAWITLSVFGSLFHKIWKRPVGQNVDANHYHDLSKVHFARLIVIFILASLAALLNPYGIAVYEVAISHIGSPLLLMIREYWPITVFSSLWWQQSAILAVITVVMLIRLIKKQPTPPIFWVITLLLVYSYRVQRLTWPVLYMSLPIFNLISSRLTPPVKWVRALSVVIISTALIVVVNQKPTLNEYLSYSWSEYCLYIGCSTASAEYLIKNELTHDIFTLYGWGGWLIWNYPEIKPLIDGRMHLWQDENGYSGFMEYHELMQNTKDIDKSKYNAVYLDLYPYPLAKRLRQLTILGKWELVYIDDFAVVYKRTGT